MINQILQEIKNSNEPFSITAFSEKLDIDQAALEGILTYCVKKGRLLVNGLDNNTQSAICASGGCGSSCPGIDNCSFVAKIPKVYTVKNDLDHTRRFND